MKIADTAPAALCNELELLLDTVPLDGAEVLELGCGKAEKTRRLAASPRIARVLALEVDAIQHASNLCIADAPKVEFRAGGAEAVPAEDARFDLVVMFRSLHHVPVDKMDDALAEIARVLKPGGRAWISEPVYAGDFNEVLRLFHDERVVREAAFGAVCRAVERGALKLERQLFFDTRSDFRDFDEFDARIIRVTHTTHRLSEDTYRQVRSRFEAHLGADGARFRVPNRVDLLRKPA